jgi:hypothetical protein
MARFIVPLTPEPQRFFIALAGKKYRLLLRYRSAVEGGWILDIADDQDVPLVQGIALVTGTDLLGPYAYLGLGGSLVTETDGDIDAVPTVENLGLASKLYFVTDD